MGGRLTAPHFRTSRCGIGGGGGGFRSPAPPLHKGCGGWCGVKSGEGLRWGYERARTLFGGRRLYGIFTCAYDYVYSSRVGRFMPIRAEAAGLDPAASESATCDLNLSAPSGRQLWRLPLRIDGRLCDAGNLGRRIPAHNRYSTHLMHKQLNIVFTSLSF